MNQKTMLMQEFQKKIWSFYQNHKRDFAWRNDITLYKVFVSEVMLQQTQTARVIYKFEQWLEKFDSFQAVAQASTFDILKCWQGLGYNRRALALHKSAQIITQEFAGVLPSDPQILQTLPGIGPNTAGSVVAFAYNLPTVFIETNIRTVFLHEFFQGQSNVSDKQITALVAESVCHQNPREWYYALMDYGVHLKKTVKANNKKSSHYVRQSTFAGSLREVRGATVKLLTKYRTVGYQDMITLLQETLPENRHDFHKIIEQLIKEEIVREQEGYLLL